MEFLGIHAYVWVAVSMLLVYVLCYNQVIMEYHDRFNSKVATWNKRAAALLRLFFTAPVLRSRIRLYDEAQRRWLNQIMDEDRRRAVETNIKRKELRMEYFKDNRPRLMTKCISGIHVVMTPGMYDRQVDATTAALRNARWEHENILLPSSEAFMFVDAKGAEQFRKARGVRSNVDDVVRHHFSGWLTDLDWLVKKYNIELVTKQDIFVPFINEAILPYGEQSARYSNRGGYETELVAIQAPPEMHPVRVE
jgi:hypothetical protein